MATSSSVTWLDQHKPKDILNKAFMLKLHKRMFGKVWNWAGHLRQKDKNIGVPFWQIEMDLKNLCDDVRHGLKMSRISMMKWVYVFIIA